jgi:uncharacterized membrane protein
MRQVVRSGPALDSVELVHDELGVLGIARRRAAGIAAVLLGTALLVAWDLLLDSAMSKVISYWIWGESSSYYGMPWMNLLGWGVTGLVLFIILSKRAPASNGEVRFALWVYLINFALPLGFRVLNRYWLAVLAGSGSVAIALLLFGYKQNVLSGQKIEKCLGSRRAGALSSERD